MFMAYIIDLPEGPEKELSDTVRKICSDLLDDLYSLDLLRKGMSHKVRANLAQMWNTSTQINLAYNNLFKLIEPEIMTDFEKSLNKYGTNKDEFAVSLINQMIGSFIYNIETIFRGTFLFFIKKEKGFKERMELGPFLQQLEKISPTNGKKLTPFIDKELRNNLAHGSYWIGSGVIYTSEDWHLEKIKPIKLSDFMIRTKKQNIVSHSRLCGNSIRFHKIACFKHVVGFSLGFYTK